MTGHTGLEMELALDPLITCKICLGEFSRSDMYELNPCRCLYCNNCLKWYLTVMISEGTVSNLSCPDSQCPKQGAMDPNDIKKLVEEPLFQKYERLKLEREVFLDPMKTWCPGAGCETICELPSAHKDKTKKRVAVTCSTCNLTFCSDCKSQWHENPQCFVPTAEEGADIGIPFTDEEDSQFKRCPNCQVPLERDAGCAQVRCNQCYHVFCWHCLTSLEYDYFLRHYERGPCKNKLGHARATVVFYRTLVVLSSPFLLLAIPCMLLIAPCLLCHHYKVCKCCENFDEQESD